MRVVVADDSVICRDVLQSILRQQHELVGLAHDGAEAVTIVAEKKPDLVILDVSMPMKSGLTAAREIRAAGYTGKIILATSIGNDGIGPVIDEVQAIRVVKPFKPGQLLQAIETLFSA